MNNAALLALFNNTKEVRDTLQTLATALSVTADLPTDAEINDMVHGTDLGAYHNYRILVTFTRAMLALKIREDAS